MKYIDLEGNEHNLNLAKYLEKKHNKSAPHIMVRNFLNTFIPAFLVYEECAVYVTKKKILYLDFFIPSLGKILEVDGPQHTVHIPFFHPTKADFLRAKKNDALKAEWCCVNSIQLLRFDDSQTESFWKSLLNS